LCQDMTSSRATSERKCEGLQPLRVPFRFLLIFFGGLPLRTLRPLRSTEKLYRRCANPVRAGVPPKPLQPVLSLKPCSLFVV
jgi:hypothetical protein